MKRREVIRGMAGASLLPFFGALAGLLPTAAQARVAEAFEAKTPQEALATLFQETQAEPSEALILIAPDIAENGTAVPLTIRSTLDNIDYVAVLATGNPLPLVASYKLTKHSSPPLSLRIKLGKTQDVVVVARADGKLYSSTRHIQVSVGGCGG